MTTQAQPLPAQALPAGAGDARWWFGQLATVKATAADTGGAYTLVEITAGPSYATPLHVHHREDEGFWMLEGHATFEVGDKKFDAPVGTYLFGPRDVPHRWTAGPDSARMLYLFAPGGFEELIEAMSVPAEALTPPPPELAPPENSVEIAAHFGVELLG
jgi:mannose-6-phosphate isomerase-like protein (cupin superfamily)